MKLEQNEKRCFFRATTEVIDKKILGSKFPDKSVTVAILLLIQEVLVYVKGICDLK